ncbi:MAG: hypothetical protein R3D97_01935 [Paracoccaceae bacterium]
MARQNRVTPLGEIIADPARGLLMGNRGILHDDDGKMGHRTYRHRAWITCVLAFKNRRHPLAAPGRYTPLFFLDEAVAFAAGHRPCAECRRADYLRFRAAFAAGDGDQPGAVEIDRRLHAARVRPRVGTKVTFDAPIADLPDGSFIVTDTGAMLLWQDRMLPYRPAGYGAPLARPATGSVTVLTPAPVVEAFRNGYLPATHPTAKTI